MLQPRGKDTIQSLDRAFKVLAILQEAGKPLTPTELAARAGLKLTTLHGIITTMWGWGILSRDEETRSYYLGPTILELANTCLKTTGLYSIAERHMTKLHRRFNETVCLGVLAGRRLHTPINYESSNALRVQVHATEEYDGFYMHCQARGKVILAFLDPEERQAILDAFDSLPGYTSRTIVDRNELEAELEEVRARGFAQVHGEQVPGIVAVAAPVFAYTRRLVAAVGISAPEVRATPARWSEICDAVIATAASMSRELGWADQDNAV